tara:strand:+ start:150 stop:806 length:657 start_codon:yes stop_codon:yes gene_type:complete
VTQEFQKRLVSSIILIPTCFFIIFEGSVLFNLFLLFCFMITSYEWHMMSKKKFYYIFGYIFFIFSFLSVYILRNDDNEIGFFLFLFIIITCISTDIGGYIFGKIFKGPKLTKLSPNKTYSGVIGSYILSLISIYIFTVNYNLIMNESYQFTTQLFFLTLITSTVSQIGDIIISFFKRLSKLKDTGKIIPGHGGLLDRIDGMLFTFPVLYLILSLSLLK